MLGDYRVALAIREWRRRREQKRVDAIFKPAEKPKRIGRWN